MAEGNSQGTGGGGGGGGAGPGSVAAAALDKAANVAHGAVDRAIGAAVPAAVWIDQKTLAQQERYERIIIVRCNQVGETISIHVCRGHEERIACCRERGLGRGTKRAAAIKPTEQETAWQRIPWLTSLVEGERLAKKEKRPILYWNVDDDPLERC